MREFDAESKYAALDERVANQGVRLGQIESNMSRGFSAVESSLASLATEFRTAGKPQWQALSLLATVIIFVLGGIGTLTYLPVKSDIGDLKTAIMRIIETTPTRADLDYRLNVTAQRRDDWQRMTEAREAEMAGRIEKLSDRIVGRGEHEEKWRANDQRFVDQQRQIDTLGKSFGDTFSLRDALQQMQRRIDSLETRPPRPAS